MCAGQNVKARAQHSIKWSGMAAPALKAQANKHSGKQGRPPKDGLQEKAFIATLQKASLSSFDKRSRVAMSTMASTPSFSAYTRLSASARRPSASVFTTCA